MTSGSVALGHFDCVLNVLCCALKLSLNNIRWAYFLWPTVPFPILGITILLFLSSFSFNSFILCFYFHPCLLALNGVEFHHSFRFYHSNIYLLTIPVISFIHSFFTLFHCSWITYSILHLSFFSLVTECTIELLLLSFYNIAFNSWHYIYFHGSIQLNLILIISNQKSNIH